LQVSISEATAAQLAAPWSQPANNAFFRVSAILRSFWCRSGSGWKLKAA
jgi:hypothetical protein